MLAVAFYIFYSVLIHILLTFCCIYFILSEACFDCLPPYAAWLSLCERITFDKFQDSLRKGYLPLSQDTLQNDSLILWAYNVALTRFTEVWVPRREKKLTPMADMVSIASNMHCFPIMLEAMHLFMTQTISLLFFVFSSTTHPTPMWPSLMTRKGTAW